MPTVDRDRISAVLPGYTVGRELGAGAFGLVLAGHHHELNCDVAIKVLSVAADSGSSAMLAGFREQVRLLSRLDHPHIVRIHDYVGQGDLCLLVMELLSGGTLARQQLSPQGVCAVGLAVADALARAHGAGVLHRDIKPDNILFTPAGLPKITDFGIAKILDGSGDTASRVVGTPRYMAPEQISGERLGPAADLYALGVVLYELLSGVPLFDPGLSLPELFRHHCEVVPSPPVGVAGPVAGVVLRVLAKRPVDRYSSARDFAVDLARAAAAVYGDQWIIRSEIPLHLDVDPRGATATSGGVTSGVADPGADNRQPRNGPPAVAIPPPAVDSHAVVPAPVTTVRIDQAEMPAPPEYPVSSSAPDAARRNNAGQAGLGAVRSAAPSAGGRPPVAGGRPPASRRRRRSSRRSRPLLALVAVLVVVVSAAGVAAFLFLPEEGGRPPVARATQEAVPPARAVPTGQLSPTQPSAPFPTKITTVAGTGIKGSSGDGGPATGAALNAPYSLAVDKLGNLYVADFDNHRIRRIDRRGVITTVAGTGVPGFAGDGGPATAAALRSPTAVAVDAAGNLFIADTFNHRIRRVDSRGIISTVAGSDKRLISGHDIPGPATEGSLWYPSGIALDAARNLYIADSANNRLRRVDTAGVMTTVAGVDGEGSFGDNGPAKEALLDSPFSVAVDAAGNLYIADHDNHRVRRIDTQGMITTVAGTGAPGFSGDGGPAVNAALNTPRGVAVDAAGNVYITDRGNNRIRRIDSSGVITTVAGTGAPGFSGDGGSASQAQLSSPSGQVALDAAGNFYVADRGNNRIRKVSPGG